MQGITKNDYCRFIDEGGTIKVTVDDKDLSMTSDLEKKLGEKLYSGFELPPSPVIASDPSSRAIVYSHGYPWDVTIVFVYGKGGKIIYKKSSQGSYEATIELPKNIQKMIFNKKNDFTSKNDHDPTKLYFTRTEENELISDPQCDIVKGVRKSFSKLQNLEIIWDADTFKVE
jgi:hypothetical protein